MVRDWQTADTPLLGGSRSAILRILVAYLTDLPNGHGQRQRACHSGLGVDTGPYGHAPVRSAAVVVGGSVAIGGQSGQVVPLDSWFVPARVRLVCSLPATATSQARRGEQGQHQFLGRLRDRWNVHSNGQRRTAGRSPRHWTDHARYGPSPAALGDHRVAAGQWSGNKICELAGSCASLG